MARWPQAHSGIEKSSFAANTVIKFWMDKPSGVALGLKTGVPTYQVEDKEGRTHLLLYLAIEERHEHRWCLWRPDHAGFDSRSIFDQGDDSTDLRGAVALRGCGVALSVARYPRNWASSLRELSAFAVCSVSIA